MPSSSESGYRYSYSGSDARVFVYFPGRSDLLIRLESVHTIAWSVHEGKGQARSLGFKGVRGFAKGIRTLAGSLVCTVVEDNPLSGLMQLAADVHLDPAVVWNGWSLDWQSVGIGSGLNVVDFNRRLATTLPAFNMLVQFVSEGSRWSTGAGETSGSSILSFNGAAYLIEGIEFVDESHTTSMSDPVTEMPYTFMAKDIKTLSAIEFQRVINGTIDSNDVRVPDADLYQILRSEANARRAAYQQLHISELPSPSSTSPRLVAP